MSSSALEITKLKLVSFRSDSLPCVSPGPNLTSSLGAAPLKRLSLLLSWLSPALSVAPWTFCPFSRVRVTWHAHMTPSERTTPALTHAPQGLALGPKCTELAAWFRLSPGCDLFKVMGPGERWIQSLPGGHTVRMSRGLIGRVYS